MRRNISRSKLNSKRKSKHHWRAPRSNFTFTRIRSNIKRLRSDFSKNSADDTWFALPGSKNAILDRKAQISNWICQKVAAKIAKTGHFCCRQQVQKTLHPTPVLWSHNCHSQTHCTLWPYSNWWSKADLHSGLHWARKSCLGIQHCKVWLKEVTYSECIQSLKNNHTPPLCFWHKTQCHPPTVRTVPGLLKNASLDGKPPGFSAATIAWVRAAPVLKPKPGRPPSSEFAQISRV